MGVYWIDRNLSEARNLTHEDQRDILCNKRSEMNLLNSTFSSLICMFSSRSPLMAFWTKTTYVWFDLFINDFLNYNLLFVASDVNLVSYIAKKNGNRNGVFRSLQAVSFGSTRTWMLWVLSKLLYEPNQKSTAPNMTRTRKHTTLKSNPNRPTCLRC